jgi:hypothetical protein
MINLLSIYCKGVAKTALLSNVYEQQFTVSLPFYQKTHHIVFTSLFPAILTRFRVKILHWLIDYSLETLLKQQNITSPGARDNKTIP